ncbi:MAG: class I SAM-dependent methyltransferase [Microscillaceae bacterium]|jgi:ubiquinone/menaquinone biosynthesis C-methylase UbiE|nr:class I SAM-dependent methyltransferase [Microscillaceae bacterium]
MQVKVNTQLQQAYQNQYQSEVKEWRSLGAQQKAKNLLAITQGQTFQKVLEVGAGDGSILAELAKTNFARELYALEISDSGLASIQARNLPNLQEAQLFDGYQIPYSDQSFDLVILSHVLEHVEHERVLLREIKRVARWVVIEVPKDYRFGVDKKVAHFLSYGHINLYTPSLLKFLVRSEGFKVLQELNRLYSPAIYMYGKKGWIARLKARLLYTGKYLLTHTPFEYINHKFINTITLFLRNDEDDLKIF